MKRDHGWCPKCAKELVDDPRRGEPRCDRHGFVVASIYRCACGGLEEFRATDDVPPSCHYCRRCADALAPEDREHLIPVVARSTQTTGPWRPA